MKCYRVNCQCDDIKKMYCIFRINEHQQRLIAGIKNRTICNICGEVTVKAKYGIRIINLCTRCGVRGKVA